MKLQLLERRFYCYALIAAGLPLWVILVPGWFQILFPLMIAVHAIVPIAANIPNNQLFGPVITRFRTARKEVWLTIDDGPDQEDTPRILELLESHDARATFFSIGRNVERNPELARAVLGRGHELGNHTHRHPVKYFSCYPPWSIAREMDDCTRALLGATGRSPQWFRPPLGLANCFVHVAVRKRGMKLLGWSARGYDGLRRNPDGIVERILRRIAPGTIILLHEGKRDFAGRAINVMALERLLTALSRLGYACVIPHPDQLE